MCGCGVWWKREKTRGKRRCLRKCEEKVGVRRKEEKKKKKRNKKKERESRIYVECVE